MQFRDTGIDIPKLAQVYMGEWFEIPNYKLVGEGFLEGWFLETPPDSVVSVRPRLVDAWLPHLYRQLLNYL